MGVLKFKIVELNSLIFTRARDMNQKPPKQISEVKRQNWPVATDLNFQPILQRNLLRAKPRKWLYLSPEVPNLKNMKVPNKGTFFNF